MGDSKFSLGLAVLPLSSLVSQVSPSTAAPSPEVSNRLGWSLLPIQDSTYLSEPEFTPAPGSQAPPQLAAPTFVAQVIPAQDGTGTEISVEGQQFNITGGTQVEQNLFHRFQQLNLQKGQVANFLTHPSTQAIFSQVSGGDASHIDGLLQVSGSSADLFVINPAGVVFGPNAQLNLAGSFTATTSDWLEFDEEQWLNALTGENYSELDGAVTAFGFSAAEPGSVANQGNLAVPVGQALRLLGGHVVSEGQLAAPGGEVSAIATSGESIVRVRDRNQLLTVEIQPIASSSVASTSNSGIVPPSLPQLLAGAPEALEAGGIQVHGDGSISLVAGQVSAAHPSGGSGGQINLVGKTVQIKESLVDTSGNKGGTIRIGGAYQGQDSLPASSQTQVDAASVLRADGIPSAEAPTPEGGNIIVWSDGVTEFAGTASAQGGGLVETSGRQQLKIAPTAQVQTATAAGEPGKWLLDPADLVVQAAGGSATISGGTNTPTTASTIDAPTLETALNGNNVQLQATNSIQVNTPINTTGNANSGNLELDAPTVDLNQQIELNGSLSGTATVVNVGSSGSIQNGIDVAIAGGTVNLAENTTYREGSTIVIERQVRLQGQGATSTIISGDAGSDDSTTVDFSNNHRILQLTSSADGTAISGITLADGHATSGGGAIENDATEVFIEDSVFENNRAIRPGNADGGAIHNHGQITISNTRFENNVAESDGGAIDLAEGAITLNNATFINNRAQRGHGGSIDVDPNGALTVTDSTFDDNSATTDGGAIFTEGNTNIRNSDFLNHQANEDGGAIFNRGDLSIEATRFRSNTADDLGGALFLTGTNTVNLTNISAEQNQADTGGVISIDSNVELNIESSLFRENQATRFAGAVNTNTGSGNGSVQINQSTFEDNTAVNFDAGAIYAETDIQITNSTFRGNTAGRDGGAIVNEHATAQLVIEQSVLTENTATGLGGAIKNFNQGNLQITDSDLTENQANQAGAIAIQSSASLTLENVGIQDNSALTNRGGGIEIENNAIVDIRNGQLTGNTAAGNGGAIYNEGQLTVNGTTFRENQSQQEGGAIASQLGTLGLNSVTLQDNEATLGGGALSLSGSGQTQILSSTLDGNESLTRQGGAIRHMGSHQLDISHSTISNNTAAWNGAAIDSNPSTAGGTITVTNSTLSSNVSRDLGGAISLGVVGDVTLNHVTVANNQARNAGGGISNPFGGSITLQNTIVAGNSAPTNSDIHGQITSLGHNLVQTRGSSSGYVASDLANGTDPQFVPLADNGGPTQTHALRVGSPAVNAGNGAALPIDQRGAAANGIRDIGAYELRDDNLSVSSSNPSQSTIVNQAFPAPISLTVTDFLGAPITGLNVAAIPATSGASVTIGPLITDDNGVASAIATANTTAGTHSLNLTVEGGFSTTHTLTNQPDAPTNLSVLNGDDQSTVVNTAFANPLQVQLTDQFGNAVPGATITLTPANNGSSTTPTSLSLTTDAAGQASTSLTANTIAGNNSLALASGSLSNRISLVNLPDVAAQLDVVRGDGQSTLINTSFPDALVVQVVDQYGNAVPGATVTFSSPASGASATLTTMTIVTDSVGQVQASASANGTEGSYSIVATAESLSQSLTLTNTTSPVNPATPPIPPTPSPTPDPNPRPSPPSIPSTPSISPNSPTSPAPTNPLVPEFSERLLKETQQANRREPQLLAQTPPGSVSFFNGIALQAIDQSFSEEYAKYWNFTNTKGATLQETQTLLTEAEAAHRTQSGVIYAFFIPPEQEALTGLALARRGSQNTPPSDEDRLLLILIASEGKPTHRLLDVTRKEVLQQARLFRMAVSDPEDDISYRPLAQQMYRWLFAPLEAEIQDLQLENLMYVLDAGLRTVPLNAMMNGDQFIVEQYGVSIIPSVDLIQTSFSSLPSETRTVAAGANTFKVLNDLPAVPLELDVIAGTQPQTEILLNESFTISNLMTAQSQADMLHLATHAEFNAGEVESSYLQFWDEQLTFDQINQLGWEDLELLILSACATAISSPEAELGFAGLAAATGVESSVGSLWHVSDVGTLALMAEFYGQLSQTPLRYEALRRAQVALLQGSTQINGQNLEIERGEIDLPEEWNLPEMANFRHPFYWSGFTLVGNPWW